MNKQMYSWRFKYHKVMRQQIFWRGGQRRSQKFEAKTLLKLEGPKFEAEDLQQEGVLGEGQRALSH